MTRVALLTREYPPDIYGGAGVHVEHLARQLSSLVDLSVYCFGAKREDPLVAGAFEPWAELPRAGKGGALRAISADLLMANAVEGTELVHSHTWYANFAGHLAKVLYGVPHVMTAHSLEPLRPWKAEQLGPGYRLSGWVERQAAASADAIIAVSQAMADDVLRAYPEVAPQRVHVVHNGIDPSEFFPDPRTDGPRLRGIDPDRPYVLFVGRVTRQKGLSHLLEAAALFDPEAQLVLCAGAPDTPEIEAEVRAEVDELSAQRPGVFWAQEMLPRAEIVQVMSHARVFVCPSIYEPFGLINIEAMACGVPVVATAVGGIPEIIRDGVTGYLVPFTPSGDAFGTPADPGALARDLAERVNDLLAAPERAKEMGAAGRQRVLDHFTWGAIATKTVAVYRQALG